MKGKQIEVARVWAAYPVAEKAAVKTRDTPPASCGGQGTPPLEEGEKPTMVESSIKFLDWLTRSSAERFRNCALTPLTLIRVESVRSALPSTSPMEERRLLLPPSPQGGPSITVEEMPEEAVRDVVGN